MCGIYGLLARDGAVDGAALPAMDTAMRHRGPDDSGTLLDGPCGDLLLLGLGHRLLWSRGNVRLRHSRPDRHGGKFDHDRGGGFRRLDLLAPFHHASGQGTVRDDDDRAADGPAAQIGNVVRAQHHHCAFSSPTSATLRYPAARRRFMTCITSP